MKGKSIHKKMNWTAADRARHQAVRAKFQREQPTLEEMITSGEYEGPIPHKFLLEALLTGKTLREAREAKALTLAEVSKRSGIDQAALSRLETGKQPNPTLETLWRYAKAIGKVVEISLRDLADGANPKPSTRSKKLRRL
jgi:DNA-binding XRE family transcriptional regulator